MPSEIDRLNRVWFDTEFIEDGKTIDLVSIGMVREDGATYYAEVDGVDYRRADPWLHENVFPHLEGGVALKPREAIAKEIVEFVGQKPEFWAYYADYDWVALCQLYGRMIDLPEGWPMFCRDLKQLADGHPLPKQTSTEHHALADALWTKEAHTVLLEAETSWEDRDDDMSAAILASHPVNSSSYDTYQQAMELVSNRRSKSALVNLVNHLLVEADVPAPAVEGWRDGVVEAARIVEARLPLYATNLAQSNAVRECLESIRARLYATPPPPQDGGERLREALEQFADPSNWVVNGRFDPNSGNFDATSFARAALRDGGE